MTLEDENDSHFEVSVDRIILERFAHLSQEDLCALIRPLESISVSYAPRVVKDRKESNPPHQHE
jgi:hypothetical protein